MSLIINNKQTNFISFLETIKEKMSKNKRADKKKFLLAGVVLLGAYYGFNALSDKEDKEFNAVAVESFQKEFTPNKELYLITNKNLQSRVHKASNFNIDAKSGNSHAVAKKVSIIQFKAKNLYLALLSITEGYSPKIEKDNVGYMFGNGWNVSLQDSDYNKKIAYTIFKDEMIAENISDMSGKSSLNKNVKDLLISPQQAMAASELMKDNFKKSFLNGLSHYVLKHGKASKEFKSSDKSLTEFSNDIFTKLKPNEQAALIYHTYRVGEGGLKGYKKMFISLLDYHYAPPNKKPLFKALTAKNLNYKYKKNGKIHSDERAEGLVGGMFKGADKFQVVAYNKPKM